MKEELETIVQIAPYMFALGVAVPAVVSAICNYIGYRDNKKQHQAFAETFLEVSKIRNLELYAK